MDGKWWLYLRLRIIKALNPILMLMPVYIVTIHFYGSGHPALYILYLTIYCLAGRLYDAFLISLHRISEVIYSQLLSAFIADGALWMIIWLMENDLPRIYPMLTVLGCQMIISILWVLYAHRWYFAHFEPQKAVIIWDLRQDMESLISRYGMSMKFEVIGTASVTECIENMPGVLLGCESVFLCGIHSHERNQIMKYCVANGIIVYVIPRIGDVIMSGARRMHLFRLPMLRLNRYFPNPEYLIAKRLMDILVSVMVLIVTSPVMLAAAIAIKMCDKGPILYRQVRLTKDGREYQLLKLRSMRVDAEEDGEEVISPGEDDERVTPVGRILRHYRIDEIPQLINVLKGEMSLIGPRPERPNLHRKYESEQPEYALRLQVKAGVTGYAQVYGNYHTESYDKLLMDLMYISNPSLMEDFKILFATVKVILIPEAVEGVWDR